MSSWPRLLGPLFRLEAPLDLIRRNGLKLMPEQPLVAERIAQAALALAVPLISGLP